MSVITVAPLRHLSMIGSDFSDSTCFSRSVEATIMFLTSLVHVFCMPAGAEANATMVTALYRRCAIPWTMLVSCFIPLLLPLKVSSSLGSLSCSGWKFILSLLAIDTLHRFYNEVPQDHQNTRQVSCSWSPYRCSFPTCCTCWRNRTYCHQQVSLEASVATGGDNATARHRTAFLDCLLFANSEERLTMYKMAD